MLSKVESVADHKHVRQLKSSVGNRLVDDPGNGPVEQCAYAQAGRIARLEGSQQVAEGQTRSDDIFDDDHFPPFDALFQVFENLHSS